MTERFDKQIAEGTAEHALREKSQASFGTRSGFSTFYRFVILDTIFDPTIIDDRKIAYWEHDLGVSNIKFAKILPRNAVIAQKVLDGTTTNTETPMFLFPFFPPTLSLPCNPGEHVWVFFENREVKRSDLGFWMCRIVGPGFVEDVNHTHFPRTYDSSFQIGTKDLYDGNTNPFYEFRNGRVENIDGERRSIYESSTLLTENEKIYEDLMTNSDGAQLRHYEPVPRYKKRPGDVVLEGTNNSLIVLGRRRLGPVAEYDENEDRGQIPRLPENEDEDGSATIDLVAGRGQTQGTLGTVVDNSLGKKEIGKSDVELEKSEGDPDFRNDRSRILISQKSNVDVDFELDSFNDKFEFENDEATGCVVVKTDKIRFIARSDIQLVAKGGVKDSNGNLVDNEDGDDFSTIIIKSNGDIVLLPAKSGYLRLGSEGADKAILCTSIKATESNGLVTASPGISSTPAVPGNPVLIGTAPPTPLGAPTPSAAPIDLGTFSKKVLVE